jgi:hypothetical protein
MFTTKAQITDAVAADLIRPVALPHLPDYYVTKDGAVYSTKKGKVYIMKRCQDIRGYLRVHLHSNDVKSKQHAVHRIVALTWLENPNNHPCVNHIDGNKSNPHVDNLEFVTHSGNATHAVQTGLLKSHGAPVCQLTLDGTIVAEYNTIRDAVEKSGFAKKGISTCIQGYTESHKGFLWRYKDSVLNALEKPKIGQYDKHKVLINEFATIEDAFKHLGITRKCKGYQWLNANTPYKWKLMVRSFPKDTLPPSLNPDEWKDVIDNPKYKVTVDGRVFSEHHKRIILPYLSDGRYSIKLSGYETAPFIRTLFIHRLVATTYIPNPNNHPIVNHLDGNPQNNHVSNLEWCTAQENVIHALNTGLTKTKKAVIQYSYDPIKEIARFSSLTEAAKSYGGTASAICVAIKNNSFTKINGKFRWAYV